MLICCSSDCEKCKQCGRYIYNLSDKNKNQINTVEPLASFGWGSIGMNAQGETHCETHTDCGFNGKYALFEPIENADTKLSGTTMTDENQLGELFSESMKDRTIEVISKIKAELSSYKDCEYYNVGELRKFLRYLLIRYGVEVKE